MIVMPPGSFMMGATLGESRNPFDIYGPVEAKDFKPRHRGADEINIIPNEYPRHRVEMDIPFAISRNETTYAEWMFCVDDGGCSHVPDHQVLTESGYQSLGAQHPVVNVSYLDALEYVTWLNSQVGVDIYRLPTEPEWEYAARAGTESPFAQGGELTSDQANFSRKATENLVKIPMPDLAERQAPVPVGELDAANAWGIRHMSGNVQELTISCWSDQHISLSRDSAYFSEIKSHRSCRRVVKGGSFNTAMDTLRPARRMRVLEDYARPFLGFRVIREFIEKE